MADYTCIIMEKAVVKEWVVPMTEQQIKEAVELLREGKIAIIDRIKFTSTCSCEPITCSHCKLPRYIPDTRHCANVCLVCCMLDWVYEPRRLWRRIIRMCDNQ